MLDIICENEACPELAHEVTIDLAEGEPIPDELEAPCGAVGMVAFGGKPRAWRGVPKTARNPSSGLPG